MKHIFLFFFLFAAIFKLDAQVGLKAIFFQPTEQLGFVFKSAILPQIVYGKRFSDLMRWNNTLTFGKLKTRLDTFPTYAILIDGEGTKFLPSKESISDFWYFNVKSGIDFGFIRTSKFAIYSGFNISLASSSSHSVTITSSLTTNSFSGSTGYIGMGFKIGTEFYLSDKWNLILEVERTYSLSNEKVYYNFYDIGMGVKYNFKD